MSRSGESIDDSHVASLVAEIADDFAARVARGEQPDLSEYLRRYPDHEATIRQVFSSLRCIRAVDLKSPQAASGRGPLVVGGLPLKQLGDYTLLREIGRGGMGIVYEAHQDTLSRSVALKVLPLAASLDPTKLKRFRIETQAAATLQHPHIVTIYGTGQDAGVHYYVMQYVDGTTLEQIVRARRLQGPLAADSRQDSTRSNGRHSLSDTTPPAVHLTKASDSISTTADWDWRRIAHFGRQLAEAISHAHEHGVIHRDIKPSNILLDRKGHPWITDFGLASVETNETLTMTGDMVGTLRYMSPEQASGRRIPIDHRTDVYSLGATLYEFLTRHAVCDGDDRETILRQLLTEDPIPLRRFDSSLPLDLETIVLKAVAKQRDDRYATAQEFADDLQRLLEDRPIQARRPTLSQRAGKWTRRHRTATIAAGVIMVLMTVGLMISNIAISREKAATDQALVIARRNEARALMEQKKAAAIRDVMQQLVGAAHPDQRKGNAYTVRQLLDNLSTDLIAKLDDQPEVQAALQSTVGNAYRRLGAPEKAAPLLSAVLQLRQATQPVPYDALAESLRDVAWNEAARGRYDVAEQHARQSVNLYQRHQLSAAARVNALWCLQHSLIYQQKYQEADQIANEALALSHNVSEAETDAANILHNLAQSKTLQGKAAEAETLARESVVLHRRVHGLHHPETAWGLDALGRALVAQQKWAEAADCFREALQIFGEHYDLTHKSIRLTDENLRTALRAQGDFDSIAAMDRQLHEETAQQFLRHRVHNYSLLDLLLEHDSPLAAAQVLKLGEAELKEQEELLEAATILMRCIAESPPPGSDRTNQLTSSDLYVPLANRLIQRAIRTCPDDPMAQNTLAWWLVAHPHSTIHQPEQAVQLAQKAIEKAPLSDHIWNTLGTALYRAGRWEDAMAALERSSRGAGGGGAYDLAFLAMIQWKLGHPAAARALREKAEQLIALETPSTDLDAFVVELRNLVPSSDSNAADGPELSVQQAPHGGP